MNPKTEIVQINTEFELDVDESPMLFIYYELAFILSEQTIP